MNLKQQHGFTLIEIIVSLGVFSMVVTTSVGALLILVATNTQLQAEQSVMTNLSFALDSMTREIRTGTYFTCVSSGSGGRPAELFHGGLDHGGEGSFHLDELGNETDDCPNGSNQALRGLAFKEGGDSVTESGERILYFFDESQGKVFRRITNEAPVSVVSSGIYIHDFQFFVTGSEAQSESVGAPDQYQPTVTIYVQASDSSDDSAKRYDLQTTVTQRILDL